MMNTADALNIEAKNAAWDDPTPALVFADWLEEGGKCEQSAIVRWAAEVAHAHLLAWMSRFCNETESYRYPGLVEPFVQDGYLHATNFHIAVRVRTLAPDTAGLRVPKSMKEIFDSYQGLVPEQWPWLPWPSKPLEVETGDDAMAVFCPICFGDGHYYAADDDRACVYCDRTGLVERLDDAMIGQARYAGRYWNLIRQLPNVVYREPKRFDDVLWFRFPGGDGLLMPLMPINKGGAEA